MIVTLNEIQRTCQKALRAAGAPPGVDDDAGAAVAWLESRGVPALGALLAAIDRWAGDPAAVGLIETGPHCVDADGRSVVFAGPGLIDAAVSLAASGSPSRLEIAALTEPRFLVPLANSVCVSGWSFAIEWASEGRAPRAGARVEPATGVTLHGDWSGTFRDAVRAVVQCQSAECISFDTGLPVAVSATDLAARHGASLSKGIAVEDALWAKVSRHARRTLVPASAESRARGAGSTANDNE